MQPLIEIHHLNAGYDGRTVLRDVDLTVYDRDFLGIIGPNGGGKTTLIRCILGLLKPQSGTIALHPQKDSHVPLAIGYLPQYASIDRKFPITVQEVILSGLSSRKGLSARYSADERERAARVIARMGLEGMEQKAIGTLSGGQLQRALLGRAIVSDPEVVILDEPATYLDRRFEARLYELLALRHHPRQPRHRHRAPAGEVHRLRQRNTALPPRHRHHGRVAGAELQLPHRAAGTRQPAPSHLEGAYVLTCFLQVPTSCCKRSNALPRKKQCFVPKKAMFCTQTLPHFAHISFKLS